MNRAYDNLQLGSVQFSHSMKTTLKRNTEFENKRGREREGRSMKENRGNVEHILTYKILAVKWPLNDS